VDINSLSVRGSSFFGWYLNDLAGLIGHELLNRFQGTFWHICKYRNPPLGVPGFEGINTPNRGIGDKVMLI